MAHERGDGGLGGASGSYYSSESGVVPLCRGFFPGRNANWPWLVAFYHPSSTVCPECDASKQTVEALPQSLRRYSVQVGAINCAAAVNKKLCRKYGAIGAKVKRGVKRGTGGGAGRRLVLAMIRRGEGAEYKGPLVVQDMVLFGKRMGAPLYSKSKPKRFMP